MKSGYKDYLDQYTNLVNQPTWADNLGDAYSKAGSQPAHGASQRSTNALLAGVGAGFKGGAAQDRQEQLSPLLQQVGQITAKAAEIEAQTQKAQQYQFAVQEFGQKYTPLVATFAELVNSNDPRATIVFKDLVNKAGSIPGYENLEAESWDSSKGYGLALNTQTGEYRKITADEMISAIAPSAQAIYGDKWFEKFLPLNAGVAKDAEYAFNTNRQNTELGMSEKRADIANKYSQAELHNTQADKTKYEMNAPKVNEYQEKRNIAASLKNQDEVYKVIKPKLDAQEKTLDMYGRLETALDSATLLRGDSSTASILRFFARELGLDENIATANMTGLQMESKLKEMLGAQFGQQEGERILGKMVGANKNYPAAKKQINQEKTDLIKDIVKNQIRIDSYAKENHANLEHPELYQNLDNQVDDYTTKWNEKHTQNSSKKDGKDKNIDQLKKQYFIK